MKKFSQNILLILCVFMIACFVSACEKEKKSAKLEIIDPAFSMRQDTPNTFTIDATGKIRNVGQVDVKNVVVTANCVSCTGKWGVGQWQTSPDIEKMPQQKAVISYIVAGGEESFSFTEVADYLLTSNEKKPEMPEKLEVVILSFEAIE